MLSLPRIPALPASGRTLVHFPEARNWPRIRHNPVPNGGNPNKNA
jgi:hypothetical protein